jgi:hypothetical protein
MKASPITHLPKGAYLHFDAVRNHETEVQVDYELVLPLNEVDCRGIFDHKPAKHRPKSFKAVWLDAKNNKRIPLGRVCIGTSNPTYPFFGGDEPELQLPFRDGAHCQWDNEKLGGLPLVYSIGDKHWLLTKA